MDLSLTVNIKALNKSMLRCHQNHRWPLALSLATMKSGWFAISAPEKSKGACDPAEIADLEASISQVLDL
jgi:hypothetical protein